VVGIGVGYLRIESFVLAAYVILYASVASLQGLKRPMFALWLGLYRQIIAPPAVFFLLTEWLRWGLTGIWWGIFLVTWSAAGIALLFIRRTLRGLDNDGTLPI
jgi:Na+-driven multidrug efflux pump